MGCEDKTRKFRGSEEQNKTASELRGTLGTREVGPSQAFTGGPEGTVGWAQAHLIPFLLVKTLARS